MPGRTLTVMLALVAPAALVQPPTGAGPAAPAAPTAPAVQAARSPTGARPAAALAAQAARPPDRLLVTVVDDRGAPAPGLTRGDFTVRAGGVELEVTDVTPAPPAVQVVAIFENLAVTQRQLNAGIARLVGTLDDDSVLDMQSVDGELGAAVAEAVDDLHARDAPRPVIVLLGQASEMARSTLPSSQVRGRRRAADLAGDVDGLADLLVAHGVQFSGVSVTAVPLPNFEDLAAATGGRFERIGDPAALEETLAGIGRELAAQYVVSFAPPAEAADLRVDVRGDDLSARAAPFAPRH